jgi:hypothetical protein
MSDISVFSATNYKTVLRRILELKKEKLGMDFSYRRLAEACQIQKTYLSRALSVGCKTHLSSDQIYLASQFLGLGKDEIEFLILLSDIEKCLVLERKKDLQKKLETIRAKNLKTENNLPLKEVALGELELSEFYIDPLLQIVQMFLTISRYAKNPERIAAELDLHSDIFNEKIKKLESMKLIRIEDKRITVQKAKLHLSNDSSFINAYRGQMRLSALEHMKRISKGDYYSFSALFSATSEVKNEIHHAFMKFLKETQKLVDSSESKEVFQINFDLLPWTKG